MASARPRAMQQPSPAASRREGKKFQWPLRGLGQCNWWADRAHLEGGLTVSMASARPRAMQRGGGGTTVPRGRKFQWPLRGLGQCNYRRDSRWFD
mgnify:CR=1 FL=1